MKTFSHINRRYTCQGDKEFEWSPNPLVEVIFSCGSDGAWTNQDGVTVATMPQCTGDDSFALPTKHIFKYF